LRFRKICLALLAAALLCNAASCTVELGGLREKAIHKEPVVLGSVASSDPYAIHYNAAGSHAMAYQIGLGTPNSSQFHFGRDFSLGTIDNIYYGAPFILQFIEDP